MRILLALILIFAFHLVSAQVSLVDSLIQQLPTTSNDTTKARLYKTITEQTAIYDLSLARQYAEEGMRHVEAMKWRRGIAVFNYLTGTIYSDLGDYTTARQYFDKAYKMHDASGDDVNAAATLNAIGTSYSRQSNADKAIENYFAALALAEQIGDLDLQASCLNNIAIVYFDQNNPDKALEYNKKSLVLHQATQNTLAIANDMVLQANTYLVKTDSANAKRSYQHALDLYNKDHNELGIATVLTNMSMLFSQQQNLDCKLKAQEIWNRVSPAYPISLTNLANLGLMYLDMSRSVAPRTSPHFSKNELLETAKKYLDRCLKLSKESKNMANYTFALGLISELEAEKGNFQKAYELSQLYHHLNDSIYSQESKNKISFIDGQRELALRDKEIELNKLALSSQRKQNIGLTFGIGLVVIIGALLYRQSHIRKKTNATLLLLNGKLDASNKIKAKFFAIMSHDLREPIARLVNFLHLQKEAPDLLSQQQVADHQQKITTSAEGLLVTMEDILLWSKGQMENFKPSMKPVRVSDLFNRLSQFSADNNIKFIFTNPDDLTIITDENFVNTIMQNLTANAVKALHGTADAKIEWKAERNDKEAILSITDNGPGLARSMDDNLANQLEISSDSKGFGFHIIRDLADAIQCKISMETISNSGTSFRLHFPS